MQGPRRTLWSWKKPRQVEAAEFRAGAAAMRPVLIRLPVLVVGVFLGGWLLIRRFFPEVTLPIGDVAGVAVGFLVVSVLLFVAARYIPTEYNLRENAISWNIGQQACVVRWDDVVEASLQPHPIVEGIQIVKLKLKNDRLRSITLPEDDSAAGILTTLRKKIPDFVAAGKLVEPARPKSLTASDQMFLAGTTMLYLYTAGTLFWRLPYTGWPSPLFLAYGIMWLTLILGPGTIACLVLAGFQQARFRQLLPWAFAVNMLTVLLTMLTLVVVVTKKSTERPAEPISRR